MADGRGCALRVLSSLNCVKYLSILCVFKNSVRLFLTVEEILQISDSTVAAYAISVRASMTPIKTWSASHRYVDVPLDQDVEDRESEVSHELPDLSSQQHPQRRTVWRGGILK